MKKLYFIFLIIFYCMRLNAQLITTNTMTPSQLVTQVLLGSGVTASGITFTGNASQHAQFNATASTNLGILSGVFLSTGDVSTSSVNGPQGPNSSASTSTNWMGAGDPLLTAASLVSTFDAAILEFDFVPMGDSVKFRYCFGSEEYPEFVNAGVNDVFAFFLSGPNPSGGNYLNKNIALLPGTGTAVSIDNVNPGLNSSYYRSNTTNTINCEFDGFTKVLYALEKVTCGQTYHIKIAIADGGDHIYDSGVFLEGGSFTSAAPISVSSSNANLNLTDSLVLIENCNSNCVYFIRQGDVTQPDSFNLQVGGNAILGSDYIQMANASFAWPSKVYFSANQDSLSICNIFALQDNIPETTDTIKFSISTFTTGLSVCALPATVSFNLYIKDYTPMIIGQGDSSFCNQSPILLAHLSGGVPNYAYNWSPGPGTGSATYTVGPLTSTTVFTLTVNDACNMTVTKSFSVNITPTVSVASPSICAGESAVLTATGAATYSWSTGAATNPITVSPTSTTQYTVTGFIGPCTNTAVAMVHIITTPTVNITGNSSICAGQSTSLTASGASGYLWSTNETTSTIIISPAISTNYQVVGGIGTCTASVLYAINVTPIPTVSIIGSVLCSGQTATLTATGATNYVWNTGIAGNSINPAPLTNTTFSVTGSTGNCTNSAVYTVTVTTGIPGLKEIGPFKFCVDTVKKIPVIVISNNSNYTITWTIPSGGVVPGDTMGQVYSITSPQPSSGIYTITVTDLCNKKSSVYADITITSCAISIPNVVTPNGDNANEYFKITGLESFSNSELTVYNRWGKKIYSNANYTNDWRPDVNTGTYFYVLLLTDGRKFNGFFEVFKN